MSRYQRAVLLDPADTRLLGVDFAELLAADRRRVFEINGHDVAAPPPLTVHTVQRLGTEVSAYIGGAVAGQRCDVTFRLTLTNPAGSGADVAYERTVRVQGAER